MIIDASSGGVMSVDRGAIDAQLRDIGEGERWWEQREFRDLPHILADDERIHGIVSGKLLGRRLSRLVPARPRMLPARPWLIVATSQRLICLRQERFGRKQVDLRGGQITGIQHASRIRTYQITLDAAQGTYRLRIPKREAFRFMGALSPLIPQPVGQPSGADLTALSRAPGMTAVAAIPALSRFMSKVAVPTMQDYVTRAEFTRLETTVDRLENELERLQEQADFLEGLLQKRSEGTFSLPGSSTDP